MSLRKFCDFVDRFPPDLTVYQFVRAAFPQPRSTPLAVEWQRADPESVRDHANVFISYAWSYSMRDVVSALQSKLAAHQDTFIWIDLCGIGSQELLSSSAPRRTDHPSLSEVHTLWLIAQPWRAPKVFSRLWTVFEVTCVLQRPDAGIELLMPATEQEDFRATLLSGADFPSVMSALAAIDVQKAAATSAHDKAVLFAELHKFPGGLDAVNARLTRLVRDWMLDMARTELLRAAHDAEHGDLRVLVQVAMQVSQLLGEQGKAGEAVEALRPVLDRWRNAPHTDGSDDMLAAELMCALSDKSTDAGLYDDALALVEGACETATRVVGGSHPRTTAFRATRARVLQQMGKLHEAEQELRDVLDLLTVTAGPESEAVARATMELGTIARARGELLEAESLLRRALELAAKLWGLGHPDTAAVQGNLAAVLEAQGKLQDALEAMTAALSTQRKVFGDHPATARTLNNLGMLFAQAGRLDDGLLRIRESVDMQRRLKEDTALASALNNLASLLMQQGKYDEAEEALRDALRIDELMFGPTHPDTADDTLNVAQLLQEQGKYSEAEAYFRSAVASLRAVLGDEHSRVAVAISGLATNLRAQGMYDEALPLYREALETRRKVYGGHHAVVATSLSNLGVLLRDQGKYDEAEPLLREAVECTHRSFGPESPSTATALNQLASLLYSQGKLDEAEPLYREVCEIHNRCMGPDHPSTLAGQSNLAALLDVAGRTDEAEELYRQTLASQRKVFGSFHLDVSSSLVNLASLLRESGRVEDALPMLREAVDIRTKALGEDHPDVAMVLMNIARSLMQSGKALEAEEPALRAAQHLEAALGPDHPAVAEARRVRQDVDARIQADKRAVLPAAKRLGAGANDTGALYRSIAAPSVAQPVYRSLDVKAWATPGVNWGAGESLRQIKALASDTFAAEASVVAAKETTTTTATTQEGEAGEKQGERPWRRARLLFCGQGGVGKTCSMRAIMRREPPEGRQSTVLARRTVCIVRKVGVQAAGEDWTHVEGRAPSQLGGKDALVYTCWDVGGQEVFNSVHPTLLTEYCVYVVCFDQRDLLEEDERERAGALKTLAFWLNSLHAHAPRAPVFLLGTHADLVGNPAQHAVVAARLRELLSTKCKRVRPEPNTAGRLVYFPVNSVDKGVGVLWDHVREAIAAVMTLPQQDWVNTRLPVSWIQFFDAITTHNEPYILFEAAVDLAARRFGMGREQVDRVLSLFHQIGEVIHVADHVIPELGKFVVLDPQFLVDRTTLAIRDPVLHPYPELVLAVCPQSDLRRLDSTAVLTIELWETMFAAFEDEDARARGEATPVPASAVVPRRDFVRSFLEKMDLFVPWPWSAAESSSRACWLVPSRLHVCSDTATRTRAQLAALRRTVPPPRLVVPLEEQGAPEADSVRQFSVVVDFRGFFLPVGVFELFVAAFVTLSGGTASTRQRAPVLSSNAALVRLPGVVLRIDAFVDNLDVLVVSIARSDGHRAAPHVLDLVEATLQHLSGTHVGHNLLSTVLVSVPRRVGTYAFANEVRDAWGEYVREGRPPRDSGRMPSVATLTLGGPDASLDDLPGADAEVTDLEAWLGVARRGDTAALALEEADSSASRSVASVEAGTMSWDAFLSHNHLLTGDCAGLIVGWLRGKGVRVWWDQDEDATDVGMRNGVVGSRCVVLLLSPGIWERDWVLFELRVALEHGKKVVLVYDPEEGRPGFARLDELRDSCPAEFAHLFRKQAIDLKRKHYYREGFLLWLTDEIFAAPA